MLSRPPSRCSRGTCPGWSSPGMPQISGPAIPPYRRRHILLTNAPPLSRHSPWWLIAGPYRNSAALLYHETAADRKAFPAISRRSRGIHPSCSQPGMPQISGSVVPPDRRRQTRSPPPSRCFRGTDQVAHRRRIPQISGLAIRRDRRRQILTTHSLPLSRNSPKLLTAGHATNRRPRYTTRPQKTDAFPPTQPLFSGRRPICSSPANTPNQRPCYTTRPPQADPYQPCPSTLEAFTLIAHCPRRPQSAPG
jgi:hypothetical protein